MPLELPISRHIYTHMSRHIYTYIHIYIYIDIGNCQGIKPQEAFRYIYVYMCREIGNSRGIWIYICIYVSRHWQLKRHLDIYMYICVATLATQEAFSIGNWQCRDSEEACVDAKSHVHINSLLYVCIFLCIHKFFYFWRDM